MKAVVLKAAFVVISLSGIYFLSSPREHKPKDSRFAVDAETLKHMVLGQKLMIADLFWIRLIQEIDYSETKGQVVNKGWSFHMLDAVTTLDPRYWMAYRAGVTVLSVLVQDVEGARILYDRAVAHYPMDWPLHYRAAYHYLYEVKDCKKAADLLVKAGLLGAPQWVASLASRLYTKAGQMELARTVIIDALERFKDTDLEERLKERLEDLNSKAFETQTVPCN